MIIKNIFFASLMIFFWDVWADKTDEVKTICQQVAKIPFPEADQINSKNLSFDPQCDAIDYYYGIHCESNFEKARLRAYEEIKKTDDLDGSMVLTMIYANGEGVSKNIPLAEKLTCESSHAPAELEGRILHLAQFKTNKSAKKFDYCDDITSGYMMGYCSYIGERVVSAKRDAILLRIVNKWSPTQKEAFIKLQKAANEFAEQHSNHEVDQSGTARSMFVIQEKALQKEDFLQSIQKLENNQAPKYTSAQWHEEDLKLNTLYQSLQKRSYDPESLGTITQKGIKKTQQAWINYRNAWVAFAKISYPQYSSDSIAAWFTKKRNHMLGRLSKQLE